VAVVQLQYLQCVEDAAYSEKADLIKEMEIMKNIGQHTNLRGLLGCCTQSGEYWLIDSSSLLVQTWTR